MKNNEKMKAMIKQLEDGVNSVYSSENYIKLLNLISHLHSYSANNCILILSQNPHTTYVASFSTWSKLGYKIKRGSKGIKILVPIPYKLQREQKVKDEDGNETTETVEFNDLSFRIGNVFDSSQLEQQIPSVVNEVQDDSEEIQMAVNKIMRVNSNILYDASLKKGDANGYYDLTSKKIYIRCNMSSCQTFKTIIHEKAHSILHNSKDFSRNQAEVEAESIAFIVARHFGIPTDEYSFGYIASWSKDKASSELKNSLATIEKTARELVAWVSKATDLKEQEVI